MNIRQRWKNKTEKSNKDEDSEIKDIKNRAGKAVSVLVETAKNTFEVWNNLELLADSFLVHRNTLSNDLPMMKTIKDEYELETKYLDFHKIESTLTLKPFDFLIKLLNESRKPTLIYSEISILQTRRSLWCKNHERILEVTKNSIESYYQLEVQVQEYRFAMIDLKNLISLQIGQKIDKANEIEKESELFKTLKFIKTELLNPRPTWLDNINQYISKKNEEHQELQKIEGLDLILAFHQLIAAAEIYQERIDKIKELINFKPSSITRDLNSLGPITSNYILTAFLEVSRLEEYLNTKQNELSFPLPSPPIEETKDDLNKSIIASNEEQLLREREKFQKIQVKKIKHKYSKHKQYDVETKPIIPKLPLTRETPLEEINCTKTSLSGESSVESSTPRSLTSDSPPFQSSHAIPIVKKSRHHEKSSNSSSSDSLSESPSSHSGSANSPGQVISSASQAIASGFFSHAHTAGEEKTKAHTISSSGSSKNSSPKKYLTTEGLFRKNSKKHPKNEDENQNDIKLRTLPHDCKPRQEV